MLQADIQVLAVDLAFRHVRLYEEFLAVARIQCQRITFLDYTAEGLLLGGAITKLHLYGVGFSLRDGGVHRTHTQVIQCYGCCNLLFRGQYLDSCRNAQAIWIEGLKCDSIDLVCKQNTAFRKILQAVLRMETGSNELFLDDGLVYIGKTKGNGLTPVLVCHADFQCPVGRDSLPATIDHFDSIQHVVVDCGFWPIPTLWVHQVQAVIFLAFLSDQAAAACHIVRT